jgi:6-pyruvoyltetrahydropterin/6-carboxytetrahydropterin synthase
MYSLSIHRIFIAKHFLIGGDWGPENELHPHQYKIEIQVSGSDLNEHGYLLDIVDLTEQMEAFVAKFEEKTLNEFPQFAGLNPSIEHFSRIAAESLAPHLKDPNLEQLTVRIYEDDIGWASYTQEL